MKKLSLTLSIPKPCGEDWNTFLPTKNGRYCGACQKAVVDFTKASDEELIDFFRKKSDHVCGRFRQDQLKAYTVDNNLKIRTGLPLLRASLLVIFSAVFAKPAMAQTSPPKQPSTEQTVYENGKQQATDQDETYLVKGVVKFAEDEYPAAGVNVVLKGTTIGTSSDREGRFEFPQRLRENDVLVFSFIGVMTKEYRVKRTDSNSVEISLEMNLIMDITGAVAVSGTYLDDRSSKKNIWSKIKSLF